MEQNLIKPCGLAWGYFQSIFKYFVCNHIFCQGRKVMQANYDIQFFLAMKEINVHYLFNIIFQTRTETKILSIKK